jgi:mono/diheme cytochrome c family protein
MATKGNGKRHSAATLLLGMAAGLFFLILLGGVVAVSGLINVAASDAGRPVHRLLGFVAERSIERHASDGLANPAASHYADTCVMCHGAPGIVPKEFSSGMVPEPPEITSRDVQKYTDGELFWVIKHGIMSTGMPAFGPTHSDEDIWKLVALVRHLPKVGQEESRRLLARNASGHHGGEGGDTAH